MLGRLRARLSSEHGAITIIVALMLVVFLGITAIVIDLGRQRHARQQLQDAVDSASLAATAYLPAHDAAAVAKVNDIVDKITTGSATDLQAAAITKTFLCVLRTPPNAIGGPSPDLGTGIGYACGPATQGAWDPATGWTSNGAGSRMTHACNPNAGDWCNAVRVTTSQTVKYLFAPAIGISTGGTGAVQSTACQGACKSTGAPLDVALVLDRTGSMSPTDIANLKDATHELLKVYIPAQQHIGVLALPYPDVNNACAVQSPQEYPDAVPNYAKWLVSGLSSDFSYTNGVLTGGLVNKIDCLVRAGNPTIKVAGNISPSQSHTDLGDPMAAAADLLTKTGRAGVPHVIIFMTDGQANQPWYPSAGFDQPCGYAAGKADFARTQAEIYTVAYGVADVKCPDLSGAYSAGGAKGNSASGLLADMATQPSIDDSRNVSGSCGPNENTDGDHYYCTVKNASSGAANSLAAVFRQIAQASVSNGRLIDAG